jgi:hypothetical protein
MGEAMAPPVEIRLSSTEEMDFHFVLNSTSHHRSDWKPDNG